MPSMKGFAPAVNREMGKVEKSTTKQGSRIGGGLGAGLMKGAKIAVGVGGIGAALVGGAAIKGGISRLLDIEDAEAKLKGLGHSTKGVSKIMDNALASVKGTSFGMGEAATTAATAVAAGIKPGKQLTKYLKTTADAATIAGTSMGEMGSILNKVQTSGKAYTEDLNQLADRGLPIFTWLQEEYDVSAEKLSEMVSKGKVDSATFQKVIRKNIGGAALESGNTTRGAMKNVMAALGRLGANVLSGVFPKIRVGLTGLIDKIDSLGPAAEKAGKLLGAGVSAGLDTMRRVISSIPWGRMISGAKKAIASVDWGSLLASAKTGLTKGINALKPVFDAIADFFSNVVDSAKIIAPAIGNIVSALAPMAKWLAKLALGGLVIALKALGPLLKTVAGWFAELARHKTLVQILAGLAASIFAVVKGVKAYKAVIAGFKAIQQAYIAGTYGMQVAQKGFGTSLAAGVGRLKAFIIQLKASTLATKISAAATKIASVATRAWNAIMKANPIGLIITAITLLVGALVWFFTKTKLGRKIIAAAWAGIKKAIRAVADWFVKKVWPALKKAIAALGVAFRAVGRVIAVAWKAIRKAISTAWKNVIRPALSALWAFIKNVLIPVIKFLWSKVVKPVFRFIGQAVKRYISGVVVPVLKALWSFIKNVLWPVIRFLWSKVVKPVFSKIGSGIKAAWNHVIEPVFSKLKKFIGETLPRAFRAGRDAIKRVWDTLKNIVKAPVNFIIGTIYNKGIRRLFNALPLPEKWKLPEIKKFASGGSVTGGQKGRDSVPALMMPGEHVLTAAEVRKLGGQAAVYRMRELIRSGGLTVKEIVKDKPTTSSSGKRQGDIGWPAKNENVPGFAKGGGLTQKQIDRALAFSRRQVGKPYIWGGVGPNGYDCSGMMSAVTNVLMGRNPYSRVGTSSTFPWAGFKPGWGEWTIGAFTGSPGHVAGTLAGTNIESTNGSVRMGAAARGAGDSMFTRLAHLGVGGNMFAGASTSASGTAISPMDQVIDSFGGTVRKWKKALSAIPKFLGNVRDSMKKAGESPVWQMFKDMLGNLGAKTVDWFNDKIPNWGPIPDNPIPNPFGSADMPPIDWSKVGSAMVSGAGGAASGSAQKYAKSLLSNYGWGAGQWGSLKSLWQKESGWNPNADNPTSSAYGIPQMMMSAHSLPADYKSNFRTQVRVGMRYIRQRYGSPAKAWAHSQASGWYANGLTGGIFTRPTTIGVGENGPERVDITPLTTGLGHTGVKAATQAARYGRKIAVGDDGSNVRGRRYALEITNWDEGVGYIAEIAQEEIAADSDLDGQITRATR